MDSPKLLPLVQETFYTLLTKWLALELVSYCQGEEIGLIPQKWCEDPGSPLKVIFEAAAKGEAILWERRMTQAAAEVEQRTSGGPVPEGSEQEQFQEQVTARTKSRMSDLGSQKQDQASKERTDQKPKASSIRARL